MAANHPEEKAMVLDVLRSQSQQGVLPQTNNQGHAFPPFVNFKLGNFLQVGDHYWTHSV